ncbi:hypothetical protein Bca4012_012324 [Brassica carinata]
MSSCLEEKLSRIFVTGPIIVGAGPSGLSVAACLSNRGVPSVILERTDCLASLWQKRTYDRLKLHLPKHFCELPLMKFPKNFPRYPSKQQFISYVESYAARFNIKPVFNQTVEKAEFDVASGLWTVKTQDAVYSSTWLVVATGENAEPVIPEIPGLEKFTGPVVHTSAYKSGSEFANRKVLVVGCGNSGMEVCLDLCRYNALPHMVVRNSVTQAVKEITRKGAKFVNGQEMEFDSIILATGYKSNVPYWLKFLHKGGDAENAFSKRMERREWALHGGFHEKRALGNGF